MKKIIWVFIALFCANLVVAQPADPQYSDKGVFFRYFDDTGNVVIRKFIPPEKIKDGYDIIDVNGRFLKNVPRALTPEELAAKAEANKEAIALQKIKDEQHRYDVDLMRKYSFVSDIESEKKRKLQEQKVRISILKGNLIGVRSKLELEYSAAAKLEAAGKKIPEKLQKRIEDLEVKITTTEELLIKQRQARDELEQDYDKRISRFKEIQALRGR